MSKAQFQRGHILDFTAPAGGVVSGEGNMVAGLFAIPQTTLTAAQVTAGDDQYAGATEGVHVQKKKNTVAVFAVGETVYWDDTLKQFDESASGFWPVGTCTEAAGATADEVKVKLKGFAVDAVP